MTQALADYARAQFEFAAPGPDGTPRRAHLESAARSGNAVAQAELDALPAVPEAGDYLWEWFLELHLARASSGFGANPIGYADISAWSELTRRQLRPWEVLAIRAIDAVFMEVQGHVSSERERQRQGTHGGP